MTRKRLYSPIPRRGGIREMKLQAMPAVLGAFFLVGGCESEQPIARQASALGSGFIIDEKGVGTKTWIG